MHIHVKDIKFIGSQMFKKKFVYIYIYKQTITLLVINHYLETI